MNWYKSEPTTVLGNRTKAHKREDRLPLKSNVWTETWDAIGQLPQLSPVAALGSERAPRSKPKVED